MLTITSRGRLANRAVRYSTNGASGSSSLKNGQFLCGLAQKPARCLVASHADKRIDRFIVHIITTALAVD